MTEKEEKLTPQELAVKRYLDEQSENDDCLRSFYIPSKIKDCFKYITSEARKKAVNGCAMIENSVVYKWARDYYIEVLPKEAEKDTVQQMASKHTAEIARAIDNLDPPKVSDAVIDMAEKAEKILRSKKEVTVVKNGQKYDKDGCALMFDFED